MNALLTDPGTRQAAQALLLPVYLIWLSVWDIRRGQLPLSLLVAGGGAGLLLRIANLKISLDAGAEAPLEEAMKKLKDIV